MTEQTFKGSCLCGGVAYEIKGAQIRFYKCHCQRCRKATGSAHANNIFVRATQVDWIKGQDRLSSYKHPESERFTNHFCSQCGSRMPLYIEELKVVLLPAGSLDEEPKLEPEANIFWASRASWSCEAGDIPCYDEYATKK